MSWLAVLVIRSSIEVCNLGWVEHTHNFILGRAASLIVRVVLDLENERSCMAWSQHLNSTMLVQLLYQDSVLEEVMATKLMCMYEYCIW